MKPPGVETLLDRLKPLARPMKTAITLSSIGIALYLAVAWLRAVSPGQSLLHSTASTLLSLLIAVYPIVFATAIFGFALSAWAIATVAIWKRQSTGLAAMRQGSALFSHVRRIPSCDGHGRDRGRDLAPLGASTARAAHEVCRTG